jgi:filamentous hemagglutinin
MGTTAVVTMMSQNTLAISQPAAMTLQLTQPATPTLAITLGGARGAKGIDGTGGGAAIGAGASSQNNGTINFANSNGVTFGLNDGTMTASVQPPVAQTEQTQNRFNLMLSGVTAGVMALISSGVMTLAAANNITLSQDGNAVTISGPATHAQQTGISGISAGAGSISSGTLAFSNSNGMSFGLNGATLTGSHNGLTTAAQSNHSHGNPTLNLTNISGTTASGSNGLTLSLSAGSIPGATSFSNLNGISFGLAGSTITASHNGITTAMQSQVSSNYMSTSERANFFATSNNTFANLTHSHGNPSLALTNLSGTTASGSNGLTLSLSAAPPGAGGGGAALSAGTQSVSTGTVNFANSNGITFGMSGSSQITASHNGLTTAALSDHGHTNYLTTAALSVHSHGVTLNLTNINGTTGGNSNGINLSLSAVVPAQTVQTQGMVSLNGQTGALSLGIGSSLSSSVNGQSTTFGLASNITTALQSAGAYLTTAAQSGHSHGNPTLNLTNLSGTTASGSNGFTLSLSGPAAGGGGLTVRDQNGNTAAAGSLFFQNANNVTWGLNTGTGGTHTMTATVTVPPTGIQQVQAGTQNCTGQTLVFLNANNITFGMANSSRITASAVVPGAVLRDGAGNSVTFGSILFQESNGVSFGIATDAGGNHTLTASVAAGGGGVAISAGTQSVSTGTMRFSNANGITFGMAGSNTITASHNGLTTAMASNASTAFAGTGSGFTGNSISATITHNTLGLSMSLSHPAWLTTAAQSGHSHGNPTLNLTNISGTTASGSNGLTLSLSAAAPGGGGNMAISAGTASASLSSLVFSNSNGVSFGLNGSTITASAAGGAGYVAPSRNMIEIIQGERLTTVANLSATQWSRRPIFVPFWMDGSNLIPKTVRLMVSGGASSNRSLVATFGVGLYSKVNDTQLSLLSSDSQAFSLTASSQSTVWNGVRIMDFTAMSNVTMTLEGRWALGLYFSASTHNATFANVMLYGADNMPSISGFMIGGTTSATNNSSNVFPFWGVYSTTSAGFPGSVGMSQIYGGNSASLLDPYAIIKEV